MALAGRLVETIDPYTEADPVATLAHILAGVGNLIGPGPHARVQHDQHPCRLNVARWGALARAGRAPRGARRAICSRRSTRYGLRAG
jgi:hypothetical protein